MTESTTGREKDLFLDALELPLEERDAWLLELRAREPELHGRVVQLLGAHATSAKVGLDKVSEIARSIRGQLEEAAIALPVGERVGDYELLEEVGSGSGGVVYRARQVSLGRIVAVKLLAGGRLASEEALRRFRAEAEAAAGLEHPRIVQVYEVGAHEGRPFFSMRWVEGGNLAEHAARYRKPRTAAALLATIARAVHHGHQRSILHRDIKPSNILLDPQGQPYIADFGVAKRIDVESTATVTGGLHGTPAYMAPEQVSGSALELTTATDVWGLGCVLYELLAGRRPFGGESFTEILLAVREREPTGLRRIEPGVPRDLETICQRALAKLPERRYPSALAFAEDLERFLDHHPIQARRTRAPERLALAWRRHPWTGSLVAAVAFLVLALAIGASWATWTLNDSLEQTRAAQAEARELLRTSLYEQARARRFNSIPGRRYESLKLLERAAEIRPSAELRDEAIACLGLVDLVPLRVLDAPHGIETGVCFDEELTRMAYALPGGDVVVEELASGAQRVLPGDGALAWCGFFSPDGSRLYVDYAPSSGLDQGGFRIWDIESGEVVLTFPVRVAVQGVCFHPDSTVFYALMAGGARLRVFELERDDSRELELPAAGARAIAMRPDGRALAVAPAGEASAWVIGLDDGEVQATLELEGVQGWCVDWDSTGSRLAVGTEDRRALLWEPEPEGGARDLGAFFIGHQAPVVQVSLSVEAGLLATGAWDGYMRLFDLDSHDLMLSVPAASLGRFDRSGERLTYSRGSEVGVHDVARDEFLEVVRAHDSVGMHSLDVSPDGELLASAADDGVVVWDLERDRRIGWLSTHDGKEVVFQPGAQRLLAATDEGFLSWSYGADGPDPAASEVEVLLEANCNRATISADGRVAAVDTYEPDAPEGTRVHVFWLDGSREPLALNAFRRADQLSISREGRWLAAGNWGGDRTWIWDLESGELVMEFAEVDGAHFPRFDPVRDRLLVSTRDGLYGIENGSWKAELLLSRSGLRDQRVRSLTIADDGRILAYGLEGSIVQVLDAQTMELILTLTPPEVHPTTWITFGPRGERLFIGTSNRTTLIWDMVGVQEELARRGLDWAADEG